MDMISRQAAIDAVGSMLRRKFGIGGDLAEITLAGLPSAQPERKTGKWIKEPQTENIYLYRCSACLIEAGCGEWLHMWFNYCPNCGAKMEVEV